MSSRINLNVMLADGGGGSKSPDPTPTPEPVTQDQEQVDLTVEGVELDFPIHLNNLLYDSNDFYSASLQDLIDAIMQVKGVDADVSTNGVWDYEIVKESANDTGVSDYLDYMRTIEEEEPHNMVDFVETYSAEVYGNLMATAEYAMQVEYIVALIEKELQGSLSKDEYAAFVAATKGNEEINSIKAFTDETSAGKYIGLVAGRVGSSFGKAMGPAGLLVWTTFKAGGFDAVINLDHGQLLASGLKTFLKGGANAVEGNVPVFGAKLLTGVGMAAAIFALGVGWDALTGQFSAEKTVIRAAQAGVTVVSGIAGTAVTSALSGTAAGSWAGPIGMAVGCVVAIVGNLVIDAVVHSYHYASNDMPRPNKYTDISVDDVREMLQEEGYLTSAPKLGENESESMYDGLATLYDANVDPTIIKYIEQRIYGKSSQIMDEDQFAMCNRYFNMMRNRICMKEYELNNPQKWDYYKDDMLNWYLYEKGLSRGYWEQNLTIDRVYSMIDSGYPEPLNSQAKEEAKFIFSLFDMYNMENINNNPELKEFVDKLLNYEILDSWSYELSSY